MMNHADGQSLKANTDPTMRERTTRKLSTRLCKIGLRMYIYTFGLGNVRKEYKVRTPCAHGT